MLEVMKNQNQAMPGHHILERAKRLSEIIALYFQFSAVVVYGGKFLTFSACQLLSDHFFKIQNKTCFLSDASHAFSQACGVVLVLKLVLHVTSQQPITLFIYFSMKH